MTIGSSGQIQKRQKSGEINHLSEKVKNKRKLRDVIPGDLKAVKKIVFELQIVLL